MLEFPRELYDIILADPPWVYDCPHTFSGTRKSTGAIDHYSTMSVSEMSELPIMSIAQKNCLLFMWTTGPQMKKAMELGERWGFVYISVAFVWHKVLPHVGHYTVSVCEYVLLFKRGKIPLHRGTRNERQFLIEKKTFHSAKPDEIRERIVRMFPNPNKRIELFARTRTKDFDAWGDQLESQETQDQQDDSHETSNNTLQTIETLNDSLLYNMYARKFQNN